MSTNDTPATSPPDDERKAAPSLPEDMTRSFTSMYILLQAVACLLGNQLKLRVQLGRAGGNFSRLVEEYELLVKGLAENDKVEQMIFLGSGVNYGLACEAMLKMKEMSLTPSQAFHFMEFRHGPKSVVDPGHADRRADR